MKIRIATSSARKDVFVIPEFTSPANWASATPSSRPQHRARQRADPAQHRGGEGLMADNKSDIEVEGAVVRGHQHAGQTGHRRADDEAYQEITRSVLMPRIAAMRRSCWVAAADAPQPGMLNNRGRDKHPHQRATKINTLVQVICTTPSPTVMRNAPLSSVGIPCWFGPGSGWTA